MNILLKKPYIYFVVVIFLIYIILDIILSGFYNTIPLILFYAKTVDWVKLSISLFLTMGIGILIASNFVLIYAKYQERKQCRQAGTVATVGALGGLVVGVCPLCITGIFPIIWGALGISFSFLSLPFQGVEIQILIVITLIISLFMLRNK